MAIYSLNNATLVAVDSTNFAREGVYERETLQKALLKNIEAIGDGLLVIQEEFGDWDGSSRRIDLLCVDTDANLVVVELKRTHDGGHMDLQALRYAAMVSPMTFDQVQEAHRNFHNIPPEESRVRLLSFFGWPDVDEAKFGQDVRIVLAAADFGREVTTTVLWLNDRGLDIRCVRMKPYRTTSGEVLVDIQQLIPLPDAAEYQTRVGRKRREERESVNARIEGRLVWWTDLQAVHERKGWTRHRNVSPRNSPYYVAREKDWHWAYLLTSSQTGVEIYIYSGASALYDELHEKRVAIEAAFQSPLAWHEPDHRGVSKVTFMMDGGHHSEERAVALEKQVEAMIRLEAALRPYLKDWLDKPKS
jgi:hypothetical protein